MTCTEKWVCAVRMDNGNIAVINKDRSFPDRESAQAYANHRHREKPFMHFVAHKLEE